MDYADFEIIGDPPDGTGQLTGGDPLMVYNDPGSQGAVNLQDIVVQQLDRVTGLAGANSTVVADNYYGCYGINGPEWVVPGQASLVNNDVLDPNHEAAADLGIVYAGADPATCVMGGPCTPDGVHAVLRRTGELTDFDQEISQTSTVSTVPANSPVALPSTSGPAYPNPGHARGHEAYASGFGTSCSRNCIGALDGAVSYPMAACLPANEDFKAYAGNPESPSVYAWACESSSACGTCGLWELSTPCPGVLLSAPRAGIPTNTGMAAMQFPGTMGSDTIVFVSKDDETAGCQPSTSGEDEILAYVHDTATGTATLIPGAPLTTIPSTGDTLGDVLHFRAEAGETVINNGGALVSVPAVVLHYLVRNANGPGSAPAGSYAVTVVSDGAMGYTVHGPEFISPAEKGTELVWLPDAVPSVWPWTHPAYPGGPGAWAFYDISGDDIQRCWWPTSP